MCTQVNRLPANPTENISLGSPARALPKYLTRDEAVTLLSNIQSDFYERDYCILTLFLNCGMRLAELVTIDMGDFRVSRQVNLSAVHEVIDLAHIHAADGFAVIRHHHPAAGLLL